MGVVVGGGCIPHQSYEKSCRTTRLSNETWGLGFVATRIVQVGSPPSSASNGEVQPSSPALYW